MTNEEAIKWLKAIENKYIHGGDDSYDAKRKEAIGIAIDALNIKTTYCIKYEDNRYKYDREHGILNAGVSYHCSNCNGFIHPSDSFCKHCGSKLEVQ